MSGHPVFCLAKTRGMMECDESEWGGPASGGGGGMCDTREWMIDDDDRNFQKFVSKNIFKM